MKYCAWLIFVTGQCVSLQRFIDKFTAIAICQLLGVWCAPSSLIILTPHSISFQPVYTYGRAACECTNSCTILVLQVLTPTSPVLHTTGGLYFVSHSVRPPRFLAHKIPFSTTFFYSTTHSTSSLPHRLRPAQLVSFSVSLRDVGHLEVSTLNRHNANSGFGRITQYPLDLCLCSLNTRKFYESLIREEQAAAAFNSAQAGALRTTSGVETEGERP